MTWKDTYQKKKRPLIEAIRLIKSGNRVVVGHAAGEPQALLKTLVSEAVHYQNVEIVHMVALTPMEYTKPQYEKNFRHNSLFIGGAARSAYREKRVDYTPTFFSRIPELLRRIKGGVDVALIQVSSPDAHGFCSFGVSCDYTKGVCDHAKIIVAQVNKHMPYVYGDNFIHVDDISCIVEHDEPVVTLASPPIAEVEQKIGEYSASLVQDGCTLQLGIGGIPNAVLSFMKQKNDLGIHSEMISDGVMELMANGNVNNKKKTLHHNQAAVSFLMGSTQFYEFVDHNPSICMYPVDYINNPFIIAQNYKPVSINSALQVDLMGQVNAETIGFGQFSGTGGQVDFVRGVSMAKDGVSVISLPSTAKNDELSRIVLTLDPGSAVTTSRNDVDYIVTEYGVADLKFKTIRERAEALIAIAHPKFRDELKDKFESRFN